MALSVKVSSSAARSAHPDRRRAAVAGARRTSESRSPAPSNRGRGCGVSSTIGAGGVMNPRFCRLTAAAPGSPSRSRRTAAVPFRYGSCFARRSCCGRRRQAHSISAELAARRHEEDGRRLSGVRVQSRSVSANSLASVLTGFIMVPCIVPRAKILAVSLRSV